jgi:hypothetical protein
MHMMSRKQIGTLMFVGGLLAHGAAGASTSPADQCAASQLKAVGKLASARLACHATTATTQHPPNPCITAAMTAFERAWKAAEARGSCITTASVTDAEAEVGGVVTAAVTEFTGTPEDTLLTTPAARACAARKLAATGKDAKAQFACDATGAKHGMLFSPTCVERAGGALLKAWDVAEATGGCATQGDSEQLNLSGLSGWGVRNLDPATPTPCGTFLLAFGWGVADGKDAFETCTSACQAGIPGSGDGQFNAPIGLAVDGSGHLFVTDGGNNRIQEFDNTGKFLTTWGSFGTGNGQFSYPFGVAVDGSGHVFVADDRNNRIQKFDNTGTFLTTWGMFGSGDGEFSEPEGVAIDGSGNVLVADSSNYRIEKFDNSGTFLTTWGMIGTGDGQFEFPDGVAVDGSGHIFVADDANNRIQKFDNTDTFLTTWGTFGSGDGEFFSPAAVPVDGSGNVFVADSLNNRIQVFDNNGTFLTTWGSAGSGTGQFNSPELVAVDGSGNVFVSDFLNNRIEKFACPIPPPLPTVCGVVSGDPAAGTAFCGGPCPLDFPVCAWVPGTVTGSCRCVDNPCPVGAVGSACSGNLCSNQSQTCGTNETGQCACQ